jgi:membrane protein implicated in regulation of membrane protease activity
MITMDYRPLLWQEPWYEEPWRRGTVAGKGAERRVMETVFLACFLFGLLFTLGSAALGAAGHVLPGLHGGHGGDGGHGFGEGANSGAAHGHDGAHADGVHHALPITNLSSLMAFLMWFGAAGYVLERFAGLPLALALGGGALAGLAGAFIVALFLRAILKGERVMDPRDYRLEGTIARVTVTIPEGGAGEILFTKAGTRRSEAARSIDGSAVPRNTEVVVIEYERGIAVVQPWDEFLARVDYPHIAGTLPASGADVEREGRTWNPR